MGFKLLVKYRIEPIEPISGNVAKVFFTITNIGDMGFQGGKISEISVKFPDAKVSIKEDILPAIPELGVEKSFEFGDFGFYLIQEGVAWINLVLKSRAEQIPLY